MDERTRQPYRSDLSDAAWEQLAPLIPPKVGKGKNRTVNLREVMNAILYVLRTGCQWAYLPRDFPPSGTVYYYFAKWSKDGTLNTMLASLHQKVRIQEGREPTTGLATRSEEATEGFAKLCSCAAALGGRTDVCMDGT